MGSISARRARLARSVLTERARTDFAGMEIAGWSRLLQAASCRSGLRPPTLGLPWENHPTWAALRLDVLALRTGCTGPDSSQERCEARRLLRVPAAGDLQARAPNRQLAAQRSGWRQSRRHHRQQ